MKTTWHTALLATAALVLAGCGDETPSGDGPGPTGGSPAATPSTSPGSPGTPGTGTSPTTPPAGSPSSPAGASWLTVTRNGGVAGFSDRVSVGPDGVVKVSKRGGEPSTCRLDAGLLAGITSAVGAVDWNAVGTARPSTRFPDDLVIAVAAHGGTTRLDDPSVKPLVGPVSKLLTATTAPAGSSELCKPV